MTTKNTDPRPTHVGFEEAIDLCKRGATIRRRDWDAQTSIRFLTSKRGWKIGAGRGEPGVFVRLHFDTVREVWTPDGASMTAADWVVTP